METISTSRYSDQYTNPNGQIPQSEKVKFNDQFFDQNTSKAFG